MWVIQMRYWQMSLFGHILDIRLLDHFLEYFLDFLLDHFFRPFWSFLGPFFYYSLLRRGDWIYLSSVGEGGGEDALAINAPVTFSGISPDHTNLEHFFHWYFFGWAKFWEGLGRLYFFYFVVMQMRNRRWNDCTDGNVNVRYYTLLVYISPQFEPWVGKNF